MGPFLSIFQQTTSSTPKSKQMGPFLSIFQQTTSSTPKSKQPPTFQPNSKFIRPGPILFFIKEPSNVSFNVNNKQRQRKPTTLTPAAHSSGVFPRAATSPNDVNNSVKIHGKQQRQYATSSSSLPRQFVQVSVLDGAISTIHSS
ncbi:hypothetical protein H5410_034638 [Solanum commersonii]|uniref:Uncharacterized protein n=1 Tax=Solanum commersonii TaxID=4109 RepID=A0A9J5YW22_SOLCO|nr:hypothetical protein H5410_034638 [Solanum commersonii]